MTAKAVPSAFRSTRTSSIDSYSPSGWKDRAWTTSLPAISRAYSTLPWNRHGWSCEKIILSMNLWLGEATIVALVAIGDTDPAKLKRFALNAARAAVLGMKPVVRKTAGKTALARST